MELVEGIEPPAQDLQKPRSATELHQCVEWAKCNSPTLLPGGVLLT